MAARNVDTTLLEDATRRGESILPNVRMGRASRSETLETVEYPADINRSKEQLEVDTQGKHRRI